MIKKIICKLRKVLLFALAIALAIPQVSFAWTRSDHDNVITQNAYDSNSTFKNYCIDNNVDDELFQYVDDADDALEAQWIAHLDMDDVDDTGNGEVSYSGVDIWEKIGNFDDVNHCRGPIANNLQKDFRLHNSVELLNLALRIKSSNPSRAMRIFANGLHLLQDYFAHLNSPGDGGTGLTHGVTTLIDVDRDGTIEAGEYADNVVDNLNWDCHSDNGNSLIPYELRDADEFNASYWHYHSDNHDSWRYQAAYEATIEYMQAYTTYESDAIYLTALNNGYVVNGTTTQYIDLLTRIIVDNVDVECTYDSAWPTSSAVSGYYGTDYAQDGTSGADTSSKWAKWTPNIPTTDEYGIYMRWAASPNKPDAVPVTVAHSGGTLTTTVNQQTNGNQWNLLGTVTLNSGTSGYVKIEATDDGYTEADAVMFVRQPIATQILDNTDPECTFDSAWTASTATEGYVGADYRYTSVNSSKWAKWTPTIQQAGYYKIYMNWTEGASRPDAAPVTITYDGGTATKNVNQQQNGGIWYDLGTYKLAAGTGNNIKIVASDTGNTIADAVRIVKVPQARIYIDNLDAGFTVDSSWTASTATPGFFVSNYVQDGTSGADSASRWAKWTPNLPVAGRYTVYMTWPASTNRPDAAPVDIVYSGGTFSTTVDQTTLGNAWNNLGTYDFAAGTGGYVKINASDAGYTMADGVMFVLVS